MKSVIDLIREQYPDVDRIRLDGVDITHEPELLLRNVNGVLEATPVLVETTHVNATARMAPRVGEIAISVVSPAHPDRKLA